MFPIENYQSVGCNYLRNRLQVGAKSCEYYTIWDFTTLDNWLTYERYTVTCAKCGAEYFPFMWVIVMVLSLVGVLQNILEFIHLYCGWTKNLTMWRPRRFSILKDKELRRLRLLGSFLMTMAWALLLYSVVTISPKYMGPWLLVHPFFLVTDFFIWIMQAMFGRGSGSSRAVVLLLVALTRQFFVACVKTTFEKAIAESGSLLLSIWI